MGDLSHVDENGNVRMVDISDKDTSLRRAVASCFVSLNPEVLRAIHAKNNAKGDVVEIARIAGIMAAKRTSELIPLCHQIELSKVDVRCHITEAGIRIETEAITNARTGVEMEALTAASVAALTIYDMCKAVQKDIVIGELRLELKSGGKSDFHA